MAKIQLELSDQMNKYVEKAVKIERFDTAQEFIKQCIREHLRVKPRRYQYGTLRNGYGLGKCTFFTNNNIRAEYNALCRYGKRVLT